MSNNIILLEIIICLLLFKLIYTVTSIMVFTSILILYDINITVYVYYYSDILNL